MSDLDELPLVKIGELENKPVYLNSPVMHKTFMKRISGIKGIGHETIDDILRIFSNKSELIEALKADKAPFRNDVVNLLKREFLKGGNNG